MPSIASIRWTSAVSRSVSDVSITIGTFGLDQPITYTVDEVRGTYQFELGSLTLVPLFNAISYRFATGPPGSERPTLLTRMSTRPKRATVSATSLLTCAASVTSQVPAVEEFRKAITDAQKPKVPKNP